MWSIFKRKKKEETVKEIEIDETNIEPINLLYGDLRIVAKYSPQPDEGFLPRKPSHTRTYYDDFILNEEICIPWKVLSSTIASMGKAYYNTHATVCFKRTIYGLAMVEHVSGTKELTKIVEEYLRNVKNIDKNSISFAINAVQYEELLIDGKPKQFPWLDLDEETYHNIASCCTRISRLMPSLGKVIDVSVDFPECLYGTVRTGSIDLLTENGLYNIIVSKLEPTNEERLEILLGYVLAKASHNPKFKNIDRIGIINPWLNKVFIYYINNIDPKLLVGLRKGMNLHK